MTEPKWTKGPWRTRPDSDGTEWDVIKDDPEAPGDPWFIAQVYSNADNGVAQASAQLIASAPQLYEALSNTLALAILKWGNLNTDANKVFEDAFAALRAARGES